MELKIILYRQKIYSKIFDSFNIEKKKWKKLTVI